MQSEGCVREHVHEHAAGPAGDERTKERILDRADDHLYPRRHHPLHQHRRHLVAETASRSPRRRARSAASCSTFKWTARRSVLCSNVGPSALSATGYPTADAASTASSSRRGHA